MQSSDQQQRIISQLKQLREQSLSEYLGTNLQSLANKQVIEDILKQFISVHEQQFLTTITNTIMQVKQQYRAIKRQLKQKQQQQSLVKIKTENQISQKYEKQMEVFFQKWLKLQQLAQQKSGERNPMKAINKLFEQIQRSIKSIQEERSSRARVIEQCQQQKKKVQSILAEKQSLQTQIITLNSNIRQVQLINKQLSQQIYQKHIKVDELTVEYKLLQKELTQLQSENLNKKNIIDYMETNAAKIKEQNAQFKQDIQTLFKQKQTLQNDNQTLRTQLDQLKKQIDCLIKDIYDLKNQKHAMKNQIDNLIKQIDASKNEISKLEKQIEKKEQSEKVVAGKIQDLNKKCLDILQENAQLKQTIFNLQKQIITINSSRDLQRVKYQQDIRQKQQQHQQLQKKLQSTISHSTQQLQALTTKLMQQKQLVQLHSQQLSQQYSEKVSLAIQQKDKQLREYIDQRDKKIKQIQQQLKELKAQAHEREYYERQYELYLQEIVELREKIRSFQPTKYQQQLMVDATGRPRGLRNKRSKIYFLLTQVHAKLQTLRQQNILIAKSVKQHLVGITSYCNKSIQLITARVLQTKLSCDYCDHHNRNYPSATTKTYNNNHHFKHIQQQQIPKVMKSTIMGQGNGNTNRNREKYPQLFGHPMQSLSFGISADQRGYQNQKHQYQSDNLIHQGLPNAQRFGSTLPRGNVDNTFESNNASSSMLRNVKKINQRMKLINHENSSYQLHLSRILSQKTISNPYQ